jgi:hypothetical protein
VDPRSSVSLELDKGADPTVPVWGVDKYSGDDSPIRIASYDEARLILAEAKGGTDAVSIINDLRGDYGVTAYSGPTDAASIQALIAHERRVTLFAEGFRQYDIQRFQLPQVPAAGTEFPKGGFYGTTTCLPLPDIERFNNPNVPKEAPEHQSHFAELLRGAPIRTGSGPFELRGQAVHRTRRHPRESGDP